MKHFYFGGITISKTRHRKAEAARVRLIFSNIAVRRKLGNENMII